MVQHPSVLRQRFIEQISARENPLSLDGLTGVGIGCFLPASRSRSLSFRNAAKRSEESQILAFRAKLRSRDHVMTVAQHFRCPRSARNDRCTVGMTGRPARIIATNPLYLPLPRRGRDTELGGSRSHLIAALRPAHRGRTGGSNCLEDDLSPPSALSAVNLRPISSSHAKAALHPAHGAVQVEVTCLEDDLSPHSVFSCPVSEISSNKSARENPLSRSREQGWGEGKSRTSLPRRGRDTERAGSRSYLKACRRTPPHRHSCEGRNPVPVHWPYVGRQCHSPFSSSGGVGDIRHERLP